MHEIIFRVTLPPASIPWSQHLTTIHSSLDFFRFCLGWLAERMLIRLRWGGILKFHTLLYTRHFILRWSPALPSVMCVCVMFRRDYFTLASQLVLSLPLPYPPPPPFRYYYCWLFVPLSSFFLLGRVLWFGPLSKFRVLRKLAKLVLLCLCGSRSSSIGKQRFTYSAERLVVADSFFSL